jgi:alkylated DNA nucleotide flippase Atl1
MKPSTTEMLLEVPFRLASISPAEAPVGAEGPWFRYVISQGANEITGLRAGSQTEVQRLVDEMIERLNERRIGKAKKK